MEVLYQLSYPGGAPNLAAPGAAGAAPGTARVRAGLEIPLQRLSERLLGCLGHHQTEDRQQCLGGERTQPLQRLANPRPLLLRPSGALERLPDRLQIELDEGAG